MQRPSSGHHVSMSPGPPDDRPAVPSDGADDRAPGTAPGGRRPRRAFTRVLTVAALAATIAGAVIGIRRIGIDPIVHGVLAADPTLVVVALGLMCLAMATRAVAWRAILVAAFPGVRIGLRPVLRATSIGVLLSATMPARLGEPARAMVVARNVETDGPRGVLLSRVLGTMVSQTILNVLALLGLGVLTFSTWFGGRWGSLATGIIVPVAVVLVALVVVPPALRLIPESWLGPVRARADEALAGVRAGLAVFRSPRGAIEAITGQFGAWALQCLSCYALLAAFGFDSTAGFGAAAAVLLAVNVAAVVPVTPSNLGVFQAACVLVLSGTHVVSPAQALGYGIVLQTVEIATAVAMGAPALIVEGLGPRGLSSLRSSSPGPAAPGAAS
jgi:phosphatidylinositol alpha-mannosyltransferase